ncbi:MAG: histidinol dehydrogenase [Verrucomicrobiae bacterium]|nr:histidinol dehydrogenase [Verrucomicrobiae bacterium]
MQTIPYPSSSFDRLTRPLSGVPAPVQQAVSSILEQVRRDGDRAVAALTKRFDRVRLKPSSIRISPDALKRAKVDAAMARAGKATLREVTRFAKASMPKNWETTNGHGARVGEKYDPLERVGIYVPGGSCPLVSTIFMTVAIAKVAGAREIVVCTPPPVAEPLLWALHLCGATEVCQAGGAQAMAAMAYGTQTIRPVDKIFGPGNIYVTEAKRQLFGTVGVDLLAGPSELMVLADESTPVEWAAADLLAQAEHGTGYERVFCASASSIVLKRIADCLRKQAKGETGSGLKRVLEKNTWFIKTANRTALVSAANAIAPEHLQIMTRAPRELAVKITTAGGVFIGPCTPTVLGDFVAGPSHTLPTAGVGRSFSGLRTVDFMRRSSLVEYHTTAIRRAGEAVKAFAKAEELPLHGRSLTCRISAKNNR